MRVLITRPGDDAHETARRLEALGHKPIVAPLLRVYYKDYMQIELAHVQAVLLTSANGARGLRWCTRERDIPIFTVGQKTAEVARDEGFTKVRSADGDATELAQAVLKWADPAKGLLLYAKGANADGRLAAALESKGFRVIERIVYEVAVAPTELLLRALTKQRPEAAVFFSSHSARAFCEFVAVQGLKDKVRRIIAVAISEATAESLKPLQFREIRVASAPNQDALLACLG